MLLAQAERLRIIQDQAPVGISEIDLQGRFLPVNDRFCEITGYTREELLARCFQDITASKDAQTDLENYRQLQAHPALSSRREKRYLHRNGHTIWVEIDRYIVRDPQDQPQFGISMIQAITERKKAEEAQKVLEDSFAFGFKTSGIFQIISTLGFRLWKISAGRLQRTRRTHRPG